MVYKHTRAQCTYAELLLEELGQLVGDVALHVDLLATRYVLDHRSAACKLKKQQRINKTPHQKG